MTQLSQVVLVPNQRASLVLLVGAAFSLLCTATSAETWDIALSNAAIERTSFSVRYDGSYREIGYPLGDVPGTIGVCTDVVIRAYRQLGSDLQQLVHEDMSAHFASYPSRRIWGLNKPDSNIDHRRVPNLETFFRRNGKELSVSRSAADYKPGDIVTWRLNDGRPHIGIVVEGTSQKSGNPLVVHNIGEGAKKEDVLFEYSISGHFRFQPGT